MKIFFVFFTLLSFSYAGWMFVNDDGSLSPYSEGEETYVILEEEVKVVAPIISKKAKVIPRHRKVHTPKVEVGHYDDGLKTMYLTFDDGPLAGSENIIAVLNEQAVEATMFMVGKHINKSPSRRAVYQAAIDAPTVLVANHTYTHANERYRHFYSSKSRVLNDISRMEEMLKEDDVMHSTPYLRLAGRNVFRLPGLHRDDGAIKRKYGEASKYDALYEQGYYIYGWDYQWSYNPKSGRVHQSPERLAQKIESMYKRGRTIKPHKFILLVHDFSFKERLHGKQTLRKLIHILREKGWRFETLETYL